MFVDSQLLLSDEQDAKADGNKVSTNAIDLSVANRDIGAGIPLYAVVIIDAYTPGTNVSLTISVITDNDAALGSPTAIISTPAIAAADISVGRMPIVIPIPPNLITERYLGLNYNCATVATALNITAFIAKTVSENI